jgi:hypothetical protein
MPNIYTAHPDIVLRVLQEAGMQCGIAAKRILTDCPTERFCAVQGDQLYGEICVRNVEEITKVVSVLDWQWILITILFLVIGIFIGRLLAVRRRT